MKALLLSSIFAATAAHSSHTAASLRGATVEVVDLAATTTAAKNPGDPERTIKSVTVTTAKDPTGVRMTSGSEVEAYSAKIECIAGFSGPLCEINDNDCVDVHTGTQLCLHAGACSDGIATYACDCADTGYEGSNCEVASMCIVGARDVPGTVKCSLAHGTPSGFTPHCGCDCDAGYGGKDCSEPLACTPGDGSIDGTFFCANGATVEGVTGSCSCACAPGAGFEGTHCATASKCYASVAPGPLVFAWGARGASTTGCRGGTTFQGIRIGLATCKKRCEAQSDCAAIFGALDQGDGSCWTCNGDSKSVAGLHTAYKRIPVAKSGGGAGDTSANAIVCDATTGTATGVTRGCDCVCAAGYDGGDCATALDCVVGGAGKLAGEMQCDAAHGKLQGQTPNCECPCNDGWTGDDCATAKDCTKAFKGEASGVVDGTIVCEHGTVSGVTDQCVCTCDAGYEGTQCHIASECVIGTGPGAIACDNGGIATGRTGLGLGCQCDCDSAVGFEGALCTVISDDCINHVTKEHECKHNGACKDMGEMQVGQFTCTCDDTGFKGTVCDEPLPCFGVAPGGTATGAVGEIDCHTGTPGGVTGKCSCDCKGTGFEGDFCETPSLCFVAPTTVTQLVYLTGTTGNSVDETIAGTLKDLVAGTSYDITVEVLRNDLGQGSEYVKSITVGGNDMGECHPDGGDYDCTFSNSCPALKTTVVASVAGTASVSMVFTGHSHDCDCKLEDARINTPDYDNNVCVKENTGDSTYTPMKAAARFTATPVDDGKLNAAVVTPAAPSILQRFTMPFKKSATSATQAWQHEKEFCESKGGRLPTFAEMCPSTTLDGQGDTSDSAPALGCDSGHSWMPYSKDSNSWVFVGCGGHSGKVCKDHVSHHSYANWASGDIFGANVDCFVPAPAPAPATSAAAPPLGAIQCTKNQGEVRGVTGSCRCDCLEGYEGGKCESAKMCRKGPTVSIGVIPCTHGAVTGRAHGLNSDACKCNCDRGFTGDDCATALPCIAGDDSFGTNDQISCAPGSGTVSGTTGNCKCTCADGWKKERKTDCSERSECVATGAGSGIGFDAVASKAGEYACDVTHGEIKGKTGECSCDCHIGFEGGDCTVASQCVRGNGQTPGTVKCVAGKGNVAGTTGTCACDCFPGFHGSDCGLSDPSFTAAVLQRFTMTSQKTATSATQAWQHEKEFCESKGGRLPTFEEMCPSTTLDGQGDTSDSAPALGCDSGHSWMPYSKDSNSWVFVGCGGHSGKVCKDHVSHHSYANWASGDIFGANVDCFV